MHFDVDDLRLCSSLAMTYFYVAEILRQCQFRVSANNSGYTKIYNSRITMNEIKIIKLFQKSTDHIICKTKLFGKIIYRKLLLLYLYCL